MAGNFAGGSPASAPENQWISRLKDLEVSQIAEVFDGFCFECHALLKSRLLSLNRQKHVDASSKVDLSSPPANINQQQHSNHERTPSKESAYSSSNYKSSPSPANGKPQVRDLFGPNLSSTVGNHGPSTTVSNGNSEGEEWHRFSQVVRKKNFVHYERHNGKETNVIQGLELHTGVFSTQEQKKIVESVYNFQKMGQKGQLLARTYSEPRKWMRGKGRVTIQFGCCYNYAVDKDGNPPGIVRDEEVDPLPPIFKNMIKRMVRWHVLPPTCVPDSCIVNIYDEGDCIPPHIDHHDFLRPFCTVSFLAECNILFGLNLKVSGPGEFSGPISIPLPVGSVLVLKGNGADVAKHCVPAVPARRISVTFRRMDDSKIPYSFLSDPDLLNLRPLFRPSGGIKAGVAAQEHQQPEAKNNGKTHKLNSRQPADNSFILQKNEFPPLGGLKL